LVEAVGSLRCAAEDSNPILGTGRINQDGSLHAGHDIPEIDEERRDEDDDIQMVDR